MLSKITIHSAPNNKPCIRVIEAKSEDDVRDVLVTRLREELQHKSSTFEFTYISDHEFQIMPIKDELTYCEYVLNRYKDDSDSRKRLLEIIARLSICLDTDVKTDAVNTVHISKSQLEEYRNTGIISYTSE